MHPLCFGCQRFLRYAVQKGGAYHSDNQKNLNGRDNEALSRYTLIAPLLDESLDPAKRSQLREETASKSGLSERTQAPYPAASPL